jgi:hypothetical protein
MILLDINWEPTSLVVSGMVLVHLASIYTSIPRYLAILGGGVSDVRGNVYGHPGLAMGRSIWTNRARNGTAIVA